MENCNFNTVDFEVKMVETLEIILTDLLFLGIPAIMIIYAVVQIVKAIRIRKNKRKIDKNHKTRLIISLILSGVFLAAVIIVILIFIDSMMHM